MIANAANQSCGQQLPCRDLHPGNGREEQALERSSLALAAHRVGGSEEYKQRAHGDRDLQCEVDGLALLEEVERRVRRDEVGDDAEHAAERQAEQEAAAAEPQVAELLLQHDEPAPCAARLCRRPDGNHLSEPPSSRGMRR